MKARVGCWLGSITFVVAFLSTLLAIAPFTPAAATFLITLPLGLTAYLLGARRMGGLALIWAVLTVLATPNMPDWVGAIAAACALASLIALPFFWLSYRREKNVLVSQHAQ